MSNFYCQIFYSHFSWLLWPIGGSSSKIFDLCISQFSASLIIDFWFIVWVGNDFGSSILMYQDLFCGQTWDILENVHACLRKLASCSDSMSYKCVWSVWTWPHLFMPMLPNWFLLKTGQWAQFLATAAYCVALTDGMRNSHLKFSLYQN